MCEFFDGWRRKAGVAALVVAMTVFGLWMRSCIVDDWFKIPVGAEYQFVSASAHLIVIRRGHFVQWDSSPEFHFSSDRVDG